MDQRSGVCSFSGCSKNFVTNKVFQCQILKYLVRGLLQHWTESFIILTSKEESVWRNKRPRSRTVSFAADRLLTWSMVTSGSLGENSKLGMSFCTSWKGLFLSVYVDEIKLAGKKQKLFRCGNYSSEKSIWENQHLSLDHVYLEMHSKAMWNKQRYCGQLQNHVWIANFCGWIRKITIPSKYSYFFMVVWHGWSCKEVCGTILWVGEQDDNNSTKYLLHASMTTTSKKKKWNLLGICPLFALKLFWNVFSLARIGRPDILWSLNKLARSITKWTKACDKRLNRLISYIHHTREYKQYCHLGNIAYQCWLGLFQDSDFAGDLEDSKSTSGRTLCFLGSHTFVPKSWMCKKQTSVSHSSTESEVICFGRWSESGWFARSGNMGSNRCCSWKYFSCFRWIGATWWWCSQTSWASHENRCDERHCCSFKLSIRASRSFIICVWGQWSCNQDDHKRQKSYNETLLQNPQSCSWLVVRSNWSGPQNPNQIHRQQKPTRRHLNQREFHTWWVESFEHV